MSVPDSAQLRKNTLPLWGLLFALCAIACNTGFFVSIPFQAAIAWLSLSLAVVALILVALGLWRAYGQPHIYGGKSKSLVLALIALLPIGLSTYGFVQMRKLPSAAAAPQVGQKAPDFTLPDTSAKPVSLDQLLAPASPGSAAPKAVLLIFYRGYW